MEGIKKTIRFDEILLTDALFVAGYQEKTFAGYVRSCVKIETQRRLKEKIKSANEEVHATDIINSIRQAGDALQSEKLVRQYIREILIDEMNKLSFGESALGNEEGD